MTRTEYEKEILFWQKEAMYWKAAYYQSLHELRKANKGIGRLVRGKQAAQETVELIKEGILHPVSSNGKSRGRGITKWVPNGKELAE